MNNMDLQFAELSQQDIRKLQQLEPQFKDMSGREVVLIAYKKQ